MLDFLESICSALGSAPTNPPANAVGAFWSIPVPGVRKAVDALFAYVSKDGFEISIAAGLVKGMAKLDGPLEPLPNTLGVHILFEEHGGHPNAGFYRKRIELPYPSIATKALCQGEPANFGRLSLQADPAHLLPEISSSLDGKTWINLHWHDHPISAELTLKGWQRLFRRLTRFEILGLQITPNGADLITYGPKQFMLPSLVWT